MAAALTQAEVDAKLKKQPKWVQEEVELLQRELIAAQDELDELREGKVGDPGSDTFVDPHAKTPLNLPNGALVAFRLDASTTVHARVTADGLEVRSPDSSLVVHPQVTNTVVISGSDY